jgi:hypothetical protein
VGFTAKDFQEFPTSVANWRPYLAGSQSAGTKILYLTGLPGFSPLFSGMGDVGYQPGAVLMSSENYKPELIAALSGANVSVPVYVQVTTLPFELADQSPVVKQAVDLLTTSVSRKSLSAFSALSLDAWLLWAKSAGECGSNLTVDCVLQKAAAHPTWDAGGFAAPVNTDPARNGYSDCYAMVQATKGGFVYRKDLTSPNSGFFNCSADNVVKGLSAG